MAVIRGSSETGSYCDILVSLVVTDEREWHRAHVPSLEELTAI